MTAAPKLVYLVTEDWYFLSHRLPMAHAARRAGYQVHVLTHVTDHGGAIEAHGFHLHPLAWRRGSMNPIDLRAIVRQVRGLYRALAPDLIHHVALQPAIVGSLAAIGLPFTRLNAIAGLGFGFTSTTPKARLLRPLLTLLLRRLLKSPHAAVLVQNPDDLAAVGMLGVAPDRVFLIPGSGVDVDALTPLSEPAGTMTAAFVGRLLADKGVRTLVDAHGLLADRGRPIRLLIAGEPDAANPASISTDEIEAWKRRVGIVMLGHVPAIRDVWAAAHIAVLPSRREGLPKSLLEAAACGRPIVATDVPGCREIARTNINALLVPPDDPAALAEAIDRLASDAELRRRFGSAGRRMVEQEFSSDHIGHATVALYDRLLGRNVLRGAAPGG
jgi:glycosyltransferase involved in cell wall biosynthesis